MRARGLRVKSVYSYMHSVACPMSWPTWPRTSCLRAPVDTRCYFLSARKRLINMDAKEARAPRLFDEVRRKLRVHHYSLRTERAYLGWIRRFILANGRRHPRAMGGREVEHFLTTLAVDGKVSASTQNQALSALLFLYRQVLEIKLPWMEDIVRAKRPARLPVVLSQSQVASLLACMDGRTALVARLLYGTGMRLMEGLRLRVKDVDFSRNEILVRNGKGGRDRRTLLPASLVAPLQEEVERARVLHRDDL